jgi:hypothetical protein
VQLKGESFDNDFELPVSLSSRLDEGTLARFWGSLNQPIRPAVQAWTTVPIVSEKLHPFRRVEERILGYRDVHSRSGEAEVGPVRPADVPPPGRFVKRTK